MQDHIRFGLKTRLKTTAKFADGMFDAPSNLFQNWAGSKSKPADQKIEPTMGDKTGNKGGDTTSGDGNGTKKTADGTTDGGADDAIIAKLWQAAEDPNKKDDLNADGTPKQQPLAGDPPDPDKQVSDFLTKQGLGKFEMSEQDMEGFKSGDPAIIQATMDKLNSRIQNGFIKALSNTNTLITKQVEKAVKDAVGESKKLIIDDKARTALFTAMPWAKDPAIAPVAETVMRKFMEKPGATIEQAAKLTVQYYRHVAKQMDPEWEPNTNTGGNFRRTPSHPGDMDFLSMLKG